MTKQEAKTWIKEFLHRIDTQDNRGTAHPIQFQLQVPEEIVVDGDYDFDRVVYHHPIFEGQGYDSQEECEKELEKYFCDEDEIERLVKEKEDIRKLYIKETWRTQQSFFTEEALQRHLSLNRHNYRKGHRDYVVHCWRDPETLELFEALRKVVEDESSTDDTVST